MVMAWSGKGVLLSFLFAFKFQVDGLSPTIHILLFPPIHPHPSLPSFLSTQTHAWTRTYPQVALCRAKETSEGPSQRVPSTWRRAGQGEGVEGGWVGGG